MLTSPTALREIVVDRGRIADHTPNRGPTCDSLSDWAAFVLSSTEQLPAAHHRLLLNELEFVSRGDVDRLMILMPPGSAKSTYVSTVFPAWWFARHPNTSIIAASHTASLAEYFGRKTCRLITKDAGLLGYNVTPGIRAASNWFTSSGSEYYATGIRGAVTGRRADLAIIDDPVRSQADVDSGLHRDHLWDWYRSDLATRLKPRARVVLVMTRWHEDDLGGRLLEQSPSEWRLLRLSALADPDDPLGRGPATPLWPEWENDEELLRKRATLGERAWSALFQQTPRPLAGALFKVNCLELIDTPPNVPSAPIVRAWDLAATLDAHGHDPDWTAGIKLMLDESGHYTILDVIRIRGTPHQVEQAIMAAAHSDGRHVIVCLPQDPGQAGKSQVAYLTGRLAGFRVIASGESGAKTTRAAPAASQVEAGNVSLVRSGWNHVFIEELRDFPYGHKDDQVDALARGFTTLADIGAPARRITVPLLPR